MELDRYKRTVAVCAVDGQDLGEWMVRQGWALASPSYSTRYVPAENAARVQTAGFGGAALSTRLLGGKEFARQPAQRIRYPLQPQAASRFPAIAAESGCDQGLD